MIFYGGYSCNKPSRLPKITVRLTVLSDVRAVLKRTSIPRTFALQLPLSALQRRPPHTSGGRRWESVRQSQSASDCAARLLEVNINMQPTTQKECRKCVKVGNSQPIRSPHSTP
jgi:hypothetical protein